MPSKEFSDLNPYIHSLYSLHPLLEEFLNFLNKKELYREIDNFFADRESKSNILQFRVFIKRFGSQIFEEFSQYIKSVDQQLIEDYISINRNNYRFRDDGRGIGERTKILGLNEDLDESAYTYTFIYVSVQTENTSNLGSENGRVQCRIRKNVSVKTWNTL